MVFVRYKADLPVASPHDLICRMLVIPVFIRIEHFDTQTSASGLFA